MTKANVTTAAEKLYAAIHTILCTAEAGKPISQELLEQASDAHDYATRLRGLRKLVYQDSHDDRERGERTADEGTADEPAPMEDEAPGDRCSSPTGHEWHYTGTQYGGDDERYHGEGVVYCTHCGADGDA